MICLSRTIHRHSLVSYLEPLTAPETKSVPPLIFRALETVNPAMLSSSTPVAPEVRDATSVAASLIAWTGDPEASRPTAASQSYAFRALHLPVLYSSPPSNSPPESSKTPVRKNYLHDPIHYSGKELDHPLVRNATSFAASLEAWTGYPSSQFGITV
jgi:hypothetical protein